MRSGQVIRSRSIATAICAVLLTAASFAAPQAPTGGVTLASAKLTVTGDTNVHGYTAATTTVRMTRVQIGAGYDGDVWSLVQKPALVEALEVAIPAVTLKSEKDGLNKNMHKALKVTECADITFKLRALEARGTDAGALRARGTLTVAGVEKEIVLDLVAKRVGTAVAVSGELPLLMTDYGITPPKAMMGMMRTDPKITLRIEVVLAVPTA